MHLSFDLLCSVGGGVRGRLPTARSDGSGGDLTERPLIRVGLHFRKPTHLPPSGGRLLLPCTASDTVGADALGSPGLPTARRPPLNLSGRRPLSAYNDLLCSSG